MARRNKRSMRKRIRNSIIKSNVVGNLIFTVLILLIAVFILNSIAFFTSTTISGSVASELENAAMAGRHFNSQTGQLDIDSPVTMKWLYSLAGKYYFDFGQGFQEIAEEEYMAMELDMDKPEMPVHDQKMLALQVVYIEVKQNDEIVFSSFPDMADMEQVRGSLWKEFWHENSAYYHGGNGEIQGTVRVAFNPDITISVIAVLAVMFGIVSILTMMITSLMAGPMTSKLTRPIKDLQKKLDKLANGDLEPGTHTELELNKPVREIQALADSANEIFDQMRVYAEQLEYQKAELEAQNTELEDKSNRLADVNHSLERVNLHMRDILDNVGQGFMRFERDLHIHSEYSTECRELFNICVAGQKLSELLYADDPTQAEFMNELLDKILDPDNEQPELYLPLLPEEMSYGDVEIQIEYRLSVSSTGKRSMIVIFTDITEKRQLETMMDQERQTLKMVVKALVNRKSFVEMVESFESFLTKWSVNGWEREQATEDDYTEITRELHTFKGNFSQYDALHVTQAIHEAEERLLEFDQEEGVIKELSALMDEKALHEALKLDMDRIQEYVGDEFMLADDMYLVEKEKILAIEKKVQSMLSEQECRVLLPEIRSLRYRPLQESLRMYPEYVLKLSERLDKQVQPFEITGDEVFVDEDRYKDFFKSLVHVFRNAVDHGMETADERVETGKPVVGSITCTVKDDDDQFIIEIQDDGRGMNPEDLRERWVQLDRPDMAQLDDRDVLRSIFEPSFTTQSNVSILSGRGVGLGAVKTELENLNGQFEVRSTPGKGTTFSFTMPKVHEHSEHMIIPNMVMSGLTETAQQYFSEYVLNIQPAEVAEYEKTNRIELHRLTALVSLKGVINSIIMLSVNQDMGYEMVNRFMYEPIDKEDVEKYVEDVLSEVANTILGNTLGKFEAIEDFLHMGIPAIISNEGAYVRYSDAEIMTYTFKHNGLEWSIHMIQLESSQVEEAALWQES